MKRLRLKTPEPLNNFMKKIIKHKYDVVTPDLLFIKDWGLCFDYKMVDSISLSFDGNVIYCGEGRMFTHPYIHKAIGTQNTFDSRFWIHKNVIVMWIYDSNNSIELLKNFKQAIIGNKFVNVKCHKKLNININTVQLIFTKLIGGVEYIIRCGFDEIDEIDNIVPNYELRPYHIAPPLLKQQMLNNDKELQNERQSYNDEGNRAWVAKHGNIDPAFYHLLMYEE